MKKLSIVATGLLGLGCLCADDNAAVRTMEWQSKLSGNVEMKFGTSHVNHGRLEIPRAAFVPSTEVSYQLFDNTRAYIGTVAALRTQDTGITDVAPYIGCMYDINDMFTVDAGYTRHFITSNDIDVDGNDTNEVYVGVLADVLLSPSVYCEYDFDREEINIVAAIGYSFDLSQYAVNGLSVDLGAQIGYDRADKPFGMEYSAARDGDKDYIYYGANADLVYSITNSAKARAGVAFAGNDSGKKDWPNLIGGEHRKMLWFNASVDCAF